MLQPVGLYVGLVQVHAQQVRHHSLRQAVPPCNAGGPLSALWREVQVFAGVNLHQALPLHPPHHASHRGQGCSAVLRLRGLPQLLRQVGEGNPEPVLIELIDT